MALFKKRNIYTHTKIFVEPKKKVFVFVCNTAFGLYKFRLNLMKQLALAGHSVVAVSPVDSHVDKLTEHGIKHVAWLLNPRAANPIADALSLIRLFIIFFHIRPNLVILYTIKPVVYGLIASKILKIRQITVITGLGNSFISDKFSAKVARYLFIGAMKFSTKCLFLNNSDFQTVRKLISLQSHRIGIVPGEGVDTKYFSPIEPVSKPDIGIPVVVMVSRVLLEKGVLEFCESVELLKSKGFDIDARLVGHHDLSEAGSVPKRVLDRFIAAGTVSFIGYQDDVREQLAPATCVVLPSYREGLPLSLLEAGAMGVPSVATDVPGCRDVIVHQITGFLCPPKNSHGLADAIQAVLLLPDHRWVEMANAARQRVVKHFSQDVICDQYLEVIEDCI